MSSAGIISSSNSYKNDGMGSLETDYSTDPASGGFFQSNYKKHDDLKDMLDTNKDSLKLEAMKRIIGMIAKGKDASDLFPAVVKNVVSKNIELKKLVYVYLVRYAEEQQDLALLSISTFQRALKEPNQLIRAGALRVLSSIRVSMIVPIVMLAIKDAAADMSPYVRKTAAHAIPKLYSLDPEQKPELILVIQKLLTDRTVLVVGSAVMAYTEVCPDKVELIHQVFRKLCALLVDVDEWGQIVIVNMLTRYARTQFGDPNLDGRNAYMQFQEEDADSDTSNKSVPPVLDPDHRLLLRSARPLLQSRNSAVVMAVAQLYHHCAPKTEAHISSRALVRLLHSHTEVQSMVLDNIASISAQGKGIFEPYLKSFFIRTSDPTRIKLLKLDILTHLVSESNVSIILRELQTYIPSNDKLFVAATIQAIGRCACSISEISDLCLGGLVTLMSSKNEAVVAESVIVIKRLLQTRSGNSQDIIIQMNRLLDNITVAQARAAIVWLLGEHLDDVKLIAPDVLRKLSKTFSDEDDIVKLQILNLAVKLFIKNPDETSLLIQYIFNLARYDQNFDIRDRARLLKHFTQSSNNKLFQQISRIFLSVKPAPMLESQFAGREQFQLGSLSHYINAHAVHYEELPPFPEHPPSSKTRDVEQHAFPKEVTSEKSKKRSSIRQPTQSEGSSSSSTNSDSPSESSSESDTQSADEASASEESKPPQEDSEESDSESSSETDENDKEKPLKMPELVSKIEKPKKDISNIDLLLDLETGDSNISFGQFLSPLQDASNMYTTPSPSIDIASPSSTSSLQIELLNRITGNGLSIMYRYTRIPHLYSNNMVSIGLSFTNTGHDDITNIHLGKRGTSNDLNIHPFVPIASLSSNCSLSGTLGINFNDSTNPANLEIVSSKGSSLVQIIPTVGELIRPVVLSEVLFDKERLRLKGMNEHSLTIRSCSDVFSKVFKVANVALSKNSNPNVHRFTGQTLSSLSLVLITLTTMEQEINVTINCEKIVIGSLLLGELKSVLK